MATVSGNSDSIGGNVFWLINLSLLMLLRIYNMGKQRARFPFVGATKHLYDWLCPLVCRSVGRSVTHSLDDPHVAPYWPTWPCLA